MYSDPRGSFTNLKRAGSDDVEDALERPHKMQRHEDIDEYSGAEDDLSE